MVRQCPHCKSMNIGRKGFGGSCGSEFKFLNYCKDCGEVEWRGMKDWDIDVKLRK